MLIIKVPFYRFYNIRFTVIRNFADAFINIWWILATSSRLKLQWIMLKPTSKKTKKWGGNSQNLLNNLHSFDLSSRNILMEWKFSFIYYQQKIWQPLLCGPGFDSLRWFFGKFISYNAMQEAWKPLLLLLQRKLLLFPFYRDSTPDTRLRFFKVKLLVFK